MMNMFKFGNQSGGLEGGAQAQQPADDTPFWLKYAGRGVGTVGGVLAIILGLWGAISFSAWCIVGGVWLMFAGFVLLTIEGPCLCTFLSPVQKVNAFMEGRPHWQRAVFYLVLSVVSMIMCQGISILLGSGLIFTTAVIYGMMVLGKKGSPEDMRTAASTELPPTEITRDKSNLVENAAPIDISGATFSSSNI